MGRGLSAATSSADAYVGVATVEPHESPVAAVAVDDVGADAAADPRGPLEHPDVEARVVQRPGAGEPGDTRADHGHVGGVIGGVHGP